MDVNLLHSSALKRGIRVTSVANVMNFLVWAHHLAGVTSMYELRLLSPTLPCVAFYESIKGCLVLWDVAMRLCYTSLKDCLISKLAYSSVLVINQNYVDMV